MTVLGPGWYRTPKRLPYHSTSSPTEVRNCRSCLQIIPSALSATLPKEITTSGSTRSIVLRRNDEQFEISVELGDPLLPLRSRGLQRIVFVMKTSHRCHLMAPSSSSNRSPVRSPKRGIPVFSAPRRPGASAMNIILAFHGPFGSPKTRRESDMRVHKRHACASRTN
jgi:hypothetical protein